MNFFDHHDLRKPYKKNQARNTLKPKTLFKAGRNQFSQQTTYNLRQTDELKTLKLSTLQVLLLKIPQVQLYLTRNSFLLPQKAQINS
jgi:hypothetical protein